jgi:integrase
VRLKGVASARAKLADGTQVTYYYAWRGGPRLRGEPGSPEFIASYHAAVQARQAQPEDKLASLIAAYKASAEFQSLAPRTQADYQKQIKRIEDRFGDFPVAGLTDRRARGIFKEWRDDIAVSSTRQADYAWTVLARILSVAKDRGLIEVNPCERGGRIYRATRQGNIWTEADEKAFLERAPEHLHLGLLLALWTGQRQGDLLKLTWNQYDGSCIRLRPSKGTNLRRGRLGRLLTIPVGAPLKLSLDAERDKKRGALVLLNKRGEHWTEHGFRSSWRKACATAGIAAGLTFHDIRGSAVTRLALAGATVPEIATFTGHSLKDVQEILDAHYLSRDPELAQRAMRKLERKG